MKDKEISLDEMKDSHTLGGSGECLVQGRGKWRNCLDDFITVESKRRETRGKNLTIKLPGGR